MWTCSYDYPFLKGSLRNLKGKVPQKNHQSNLIFWIALGVVLLVLVGPSKVKHFGLEVCPQGPQMAAPHGTSNESTLVPQILKDQNIQFQGHAYFPDLI